jgi:hypothetical protein
MHILKTATAWTSAERTAAYILAGIAAGEGVWAYFNIVGRAGKFWRFIRVPTPRSRRWWDGRSR